MSITPSQKSPYFLPFLIATVSIIAIGATAFVMLQSNKVVDNKDTSSTSKNESTNNKTVMLKNANKFSFVEYEEKEPLILDENGNGVRCGIDGIKTYTVLGGNPERGDVAAKIAITNRDLAAKYNASPSLDQVDLVLSKNRFKTEMPLTKAEYFKFVDMNNTNNSLNAAFKTDDCTGEFLDAPIRYLNSIPYPGMDKSQALLSTGGQGSQFSLEILVSAKKGNEYFRLTEYVLHEAAFNKEERNICDAKAESEIEGCYVDLANTSDRINKLAEDTANKLINLFEII